MGRWWCGWGGSGVDGEVVVRMGRWWCGWGGGGVDGEVVV